jgi:arylsulfatase A-like enzyme
VKSGQLFEELLTLRNELGDADLDELRRLYDSEIAHTDAQIGRVLARLAELGLESDTLVVITADHGEEFKDHGRLGHAKTLYEELIGVPLLMRFPGRGAGVVREPVGLIDVYPTVLAAAGIPLPAGLAGVPIGPGSPHLEPTRIVFSETARNGGLRAAVDGTHKLIQLARGAREELYAASDVGETTNLYAEQGPARARLRAALAGFAELQAAGRVAPEVRLDDATRRELADMGYAGGANDDE